MRTFFLDAASHDGLVACTEWDTLVAFRSIAGRIADHEILPLLEEVLQGVSWSLEDLERLACVIGPGGFTSLRVGVAFANALSFALGVPLAPVHLADLWDARVDRGRGSSFLWVHSTKRKEVFVRSFGIGPWVEPTHLSIDALLSASPSSVPFAGELLPDHASALEERGWRRAPARPIAATLPGFLGRLPYTPARILPWYGREP